MTEVDNGILINMRKPMTLFFTPVKEILLRYAFEMREIPFDKK